ncbi:TonB-dependent receptor, partial [Caulobacter sp. B11]
MITRRLTTLLLLSTALSMPSWAIAQTAPASGAPSSDAPAAATPQTQTEPQEQTDVSIPGMVDQVVVTATRNGNIVKTGSQVVTVLSSADIVRTGEGNIAGALS